jgi:hypothetical protein
MQGQYNHTVTACFIFNLRKKEDIRFVAILQLFVGREEGFSCFTFYCTCTVVGTVISEYVSNLECASVGTTGLL